ncbi:aspartate kinase [Anaeroplasma bactoclasticum]|jgi:aspartate kinase|uniref:Aspartokinase n=1 Tax=Anaeroplasma bactoclasticum TaxID=2088 RepID=A0A397RZS6_9MOLU|nr:aspartate kinase [Anaeroplasma bactoclasticum]RIA78056.1 aspartate kinase [Anaeroplasma bactoclasticum]
MLAVAKFGGSSLSNATQFAKVKNIVLSDPKRQIVVCSALGKRDKSDTKITDLLYILHAHLKFSVPYEDIWDMLYTRFTGVQADLGIDYDIEADLNQLKSELNKSISEEYLVSRGEYLTSKLMASYLGYQWVDAKDLLRYNYDGKLDEIQTEKNVNLAFSKYGKIVVPGFYGAYPNGSVKLLSRGGSDVTGAILAKALNVTVYENWTDVSGVLSADPRLVKNPKAIKEITYAELRELSYMGASVLHEETVFPVQQLNIPINLRNTNEPENPGTTIREVCSDTTQTVTGIAGKKDFCAFNIFKDHMSNEVGFMAKTLAIFKDYEVSIEHVPSGIDSFSVVVPYSQVEKCQYELVTDLKKELDAEVTFEKDLALVAVVGRNMAKRAGICGKIFAALGEERVNVRLLAQGPQELNIIIGVSASDYEKTIALLYDALIK